jgi:chemotaxis-related protein WspB
MLLLTFQADNQHYAIDAGHVLEVIPIVKIRKLPGTPGFVRGVLNYRGTPVPVIDITLMLSGRPSVEHLSSRIILVKYPEKGESENVLGVLAEHATDTAIRETADFIDSGIASPGMPCLGKISVVGKTMLQIVKIDDLLTDELKAILFAAQGEKSL